MNEKLSCLNISEISEKKLFGYLSQQRGFIYLESAGRLSANCRFNFMGFNPFKILLTANGITTITDQNGLKQTDENPFQLLDSLLKSHKTNLKSNKTPFLSGAMGFISYEAARHLKNIPETTLKNPNPNWPELFFGFYNTIIIIDKKTHKKWLFHPRNKPDIKKILSDLKPNKKMARPILSKLKPDIAYNTYCRMLKTAKHHITEGDIYQANLSYPLSGQVEGSLALLYQQLKNKARAPYSAFINLQPHYVLSTSPEQFFQIRGRQIKSRPIKGTAPRGHTKKQDAQNKDQLRASKKNRAELMMIVDLIRNDLGQVCGYGSVRVPNLCQLETHPNLFHLVATVEGILKQNTNAVDALRALFPGGSITGAPKISAMKIINRLERTPRNIYTGSIGYIDFNGNADFNIAIRTAYIHKNRLHFHTGGGIVADSKTKEEWNETLIKAKNITQTLK